MVSLGDKKRPTSCDSEGPTTGYLVLVPSGSVEERVLLNSCLELGFKAVYQVDPTQFNLSQHEPFTVIPGSKG